jgi:FK506-binding nuclear protein
MAALDPTEAPEADEDGNIPAIPRATLKIVRQKFTDLDDEVDDEYLEKLMAGGSDDSDSDEDSEGDEEANGGPSDPSKTKKAKAEAALKKLIEAAQEEEDSDEDMADDAEGKTNGVGKAVKKGKEPATSSDDDDEESLDGDEVDMEEFVICTLDTERVSDPRLNVT